MRAFMHRLHDPCFRVAQRGRGIGMLCERPLDAAEQAAAGRLLRRADAANAPREAALLTSAPFAPRRPGHVVEYLVVGAGVWLHRLRDSKRGLFSRLPALACLERVRAH